MSDLTLSERHQQILKLLQQQGSISVNSLSELLQVSEVTIRKDLSLLEQKKKLYRSHGSAILINPYIGDRNVSEKEKQNVNEKLAIGLKATEYIEENDSILIASGTTMSFLAQQIEQQIKQITVVTSSLPVTSILSKNKNITVYQLGGFVRDSSLSVVGDSAGEMLKNFHCKILFLGVDGIDFDFGLTTTNVPEANLNRAMMNAVQKIIVLADSSKFNKKGFIKICDLNIIDEIITDNKISLQLQQSLIDKGIEITIVSTEKNLKCK